MNLNNKENRSFEVILVLWLFTFFVYFSISIFYFIFPLYYINNSNKVIITTTGKYIIK